MHGSISHPDPTTRRREALARVFGVLTGELRGAAAATTDPSVAESLREFTRLLSAVDLDRAAREPAGQGERLTVTGLWAASLQAANGVPRALVAGPAAGPPALAVDPRLALGVLLLGPHAHYPLHAHPAVEIYYTLTAGAEWWRGGGPWRQEPAGAAIHHAPNVRHATRAGVTPLLAIYLWRGDLVTHAELTGGGPRAPA